MTGEMMMNATTERVCAFDGCADGPPKLTGGAARESSEQPAVTWPDPPAPEAYYGLAGDVVRAIEPHSEADPVGECSFTLMSCSGT